MTHVAAAIHFRWTETMVQWTMFYNLSLRDRNINFGPGAFTYVPRTEMLAALHGNPLGERRMIEVNANSNLQEQLWKGEGSLVF